MEMTLNSRDLALVSRDIRSCTRCEISCRGHAPVKVDGQGTLMIIGESASAPDVRLGTPHTGPAGKLTRAIIRQCGIKDVAWANVVSCHPSIRGCGASMALRKTRSPSINEISNCRGLLLQQLNAVNPKAVLLLGATALASWREDLNLDKQHGSFGYWMKRPTMATYHPAFVLRGAEEVRFIIQSDIQLLARVLKGEPWTNHTNVSCCVKKCPLDSVSRDPEYVGYCFMHWKRAGGKWRKEAKKWKIRQATKDQPTLW